jgi:hypothetical protein
MELRPLEQPRPYFKPPPYDVKLLLNAHGANLRPAFNWDEAFDRSITVCMQRLTCEQRCAGMLLPFLSSPLSLPSLYHAFYSFPLSFHSFLP